MFGAIPADLILDYASSTGAYYQLDLNLDCPPWVFVRPEHLTSVTNELYYLNEHGKSYGSLSSIDHPSFTATREWLGKNGYIKIEKGWCNGDRVTKPFYFNNVYMEVGDKFSCASAMKYKYGKPELYNDRKPLPIKNYKENPEW